MKFDLIEIRYESLVDKLPLIGNIPIFIHSETFETPFGEIILKDYPKLFRKLEWYEYREFNLKKVKCVVEKMAWDILIKVGEEFEVRSFVLA